MATVPEHELLAMQNMSDYEQMLHIDRLCTTYGVDEATLRALMQRVTSTQNPATKPPPDSWDTSHKEVPGLQDAITPTSPNLLDKQQFRFTYDPSREAGERRKQVNQAILCAACGVALGIPDIRPIKVTCPSCLFETTYTN